MAVLHLRVIRYFFKAKHVYNANVNRDANTLILLFRDNCDYFLPFKAVY